MLEKVRQAAAEQAKRAAEAASRTAQVGMDRAVEVAKDPATHAKAKLVARQTAQVTAKGAVKGAGAAGHAVKSALDKLNPDLLASVVIKATALQEQANATLRRSGSLYRISGIAIGAAFPPSVTFQIGRLSDLGREMIENPESAPESGAPDIAEIATADGAG
jgi:hypothetical protein